jgi:hypothetical protein
MFEARVNCAWVRQAIACRRDYCRPGLYRKLGVDPVPTLPPFSIVTTFAFSAHFDTGSLQLGTSEMKFTSRSVGWRSPRGA